ncbi:hypothetical protein [Campylobacter sp. RM16188]|uniref:hypothetical protein n=1 Tax=Campylobacter sp. RM16188 TaxID=1705725 RepID=UPI001552ABFB|nr:hypothetical protein [Campylobacter sp. RM16188]
MKIQDKIDFYDKIKNFFKMNWWLVWLSNIAICAFVFFATQKMSAENQAIKSLLEQEVKGVVFVGQNGQVAFSEKARIDASSDSKFKSAIKNNLVDYVITDASRVTKNYTVKIRTPDDIFDNYLPLKEFGENFIALGNEKYPNAFGFYKTLLAGLSQAIERDTLPDQILPVDSTISTYTWDDQTQTFSIVVNVFVNSYVYNSMTNTFDKKDGTVQIRAKGFFDLMNGSIINPLGIKYFEVGITNASK